MVQSQAKVVLLFGGNLGDRPQNIRKAEVLIQERIGKIIHSSSIYESVAWGFESEEKFLNQVTIVKTKLSPQDLLKKCHIIEDLFGRVRNPEHYISRTMDLDILFYNDQIIEEPKLIIPHEHLHKRKFTLLPLSEILPNYVHPRLKKSLKDLLINCEDPSEVSIFEA